MLPLDIPPPPTNVPSPIADLFHPLRDVSASAIANHNRALYEAFLMPCSSNTFIPNERLRMLRNQIVNGSYGEQLIRKINLVLQEQLLFLKAWEYPAGGSESTLLDPYVIKVILDQVAKQCDNLYVSVTKDAVPFVPVMCGSLKSGHRCQYSKSGVVQVLATSECKGVNASQFDCLMQALELAADSSLHLSRSTNIPSEQCSTPGVIVYADKVQFYGVYLVDDFPVIVLLSPPLAFVDVCDRLQIVRGILAMADYIKASVELLELSDSVNPLRPLYFNYDSVFFKPVRTHSKLNANRQETSLFSTGMTNVHLSMYSIYTRRLVTQIGDQSLFPCRLACFASLRILVETSLLLLCGCWILISVNLKMFRMPL